MAERFVLRVLTLVAFGWALASCGGESVDGEPFRDGSPTPGDTSTPGAAGSSSNTTDSQTAAPSGCCRICIEGKACGDSCISRDLTCAVGAGCACDS